MIQRVLDNFVKPRRLFDVSSRKDLDAFAHYLKTDSWGHEGCPFLVEEPWHSIPDMIKDKIVRKHLKL